MELTELIAQAPWREAVTYRETWPHEYVVIKKDKQEELLDAVCKRFCAGEGVDGRFFRMKNKYLFIGDYKYWLMTPCTKIDLKNDDYVLNRALIYRDRRDFFIKDGDDGRRNTTIDSVFGINPSEYNNGAKANDKSLTGKLERVPVKNVWEHEALDFTPWLAKNLSLLGEALDMDLEPVQEEARSGGFSLDILAEDAKSGALVAIENQLEWTDDGHLGQLLTYAGWHDARILVWVAPHFTQQHRDALERLNRWTPYEIEVYGVEVSAVKIGYSKPGPVFKPVVLPRAWFARRTAEFAGISMPAAKRRMFFQPLLDRLRKVRFTEQGTASSTEYRSFPVGIPGDGTYRASIEGTKAWVYIGGNYNYAAPRDITDGLRDCDKAEVEKALGIEGDSVTEMDWHTTTTRNIGVWRYGSIDDSEVELEEIREWMFHYLLKFKEVFNPRIEEIVKRRGEAEESD